MSLIIFSLVIGLGVKLAFGLHIWLPYAHSEAPTPISALLSPAMIGIGAHGLLRLWMDLLTGDYTQYSIYINIWGLITMIYGGAMALMQDDIKEFLHTLALVRWVTFYLVWDLKAFWASAGRH